jgi:hypothetical protein
LSQDTDSDWVIEEFGAADLGDARRTARLVTLARQLACSPHCSFPQSLSQAQLKAAYRFFDNDGVDTGGILSSHIGQTLGRMRGLPVVLAVPDSTEYNLTHLPATLHRFASTHSPAAQPYRQRIGRCRRVRRLDHRNGPAQRDRADR